MQHNILSFFCVPKSIALYQLIKLEKSKKNENLKVIVAMSGGVDSSVAAALLNEQGYNVIGVTMKTWGYDNIPDKDSGCCSLESIYNARNVADELGISHYTMDFTSKFNETVINNFIDEYVHGRTPNPCVLCNRSIKWGALLEKAESLGADFIATGHYAKVNLNVSSNRYYISAANDRNKDQSYALWMLKQHSLSKTIFPLGDLKKNEVRELAKKYNLKSADVPDSQEICFVPNNDYRELLKVRIPDINEKINSGDIIYHDNKIGTHNGYINYTIGQRRGLNTLVNKPLYVSKIDAENNIIYVDDEENLYNSMFTTKDVNLMLMDSINHPMNAIVKIRYKDAGEDATIEQINEDHIKVTYHKPKKAITPGQSAVFYDGDDIIGGGIIDSIIE
jgi:tRNA-specific 2-thiouridylase